MNVENLVPLREWVENSVKSMPFSKSKWNPVEMRELLEYATARLQDPVNRAQAPCKICGEPAAWFDVVDLNKSCTPAQYPFGLSGIPVFYRCCTSCGFIFTDFFDQFSDEQWRRLIYDEAYQSVDPDYVDVRPKKNALEIQTLLGSRKQEILALDYGGGNGLTARLLCASGWAVDTYDPFGHCEMKPDRARKYNFCSTFEVFEHSPHPSVLLQNIVDLISPHKVMILIGTGISDTNVSEQNRLSWWYAAPRNGHVSLYSRKSLVILGAKFGLNYASVSNGTHLLYRGFTSREIHLLLIWGKASKRLRLLMERVSQKSSISCSQGSFRLPDH